MKKSITLSVFIFLALIVNAQEELIADVSITSKTFPAVTKLLEGRISCPTLAVTINKTESITPFKTYTLQNENWILQQDIYNAMRTKVPGLSIKNDLNGNAAPTVSMRGDDNTIVIVDGVRFNASILHTLNPVDIESITVTNSLAAQNYFRLR